MRIVCNGEYQLPKLQFKEGLIRFPSCIKMRYHRIKKCLHCRIIFNTHDCIKMFNPCGERYFFLLQYIVNEFIRQKKYFKAKSGIKELFNDTGAFSYKHAT